MATLRRALGRLREHGDWPAADAVRVRELARYFSPAPPVSVRLLLRRMELRLQPVAVEHHPWRPLYRRRRPKPQGRGDHESDLAHIDLRRAHLAPYGEPDPVGQAGRLFDARTAAAIKAQVGDPAVLTATRPLRWHGDREHNLLDGDYDLETVVARAKCLAAMAYPDYFPDGDHLHGLVSQALLLAQPGWCGTFGPRMTDIESVLFDKGAGDYDMRQMFLLPIAYRYYGELSPEAREQLITVLLAKGRIRRPGLGVMETSGPCPLDWARAGVARAAIPGPVPIIINERIGETENHILMMLTVRYLANQLLYQRSPARSFDNRRNGTAILFDQPTQVGVDCTGQLLVFLRWMLTNDFSEYNAKPYATLTRYALLNLHSYAYDHEVRLAARMVLDYLAAHMAVSSNDLRRLVPFRRRNEGDFIAQFKVADDNGRYMAVGLLDAHVGADRMAQHYVVQTGQTRAYETGWAKRPWEWAVASNGEESTFEGVSDYRLPSPIHDLFVNDRHRRFFQRLHRRVLPDVDLTGRNCDMLEIYAGSPSYLITAGSSNQPYAIAPGSAPASVVRQQLGVAVTTSFMPTCRSAGPRTQNRARDLIQFSCFSDGVDSGGEPEFPVANLGVAPDFACGHQVHLPGWVIAASVRQAITRLRELGRLPGGAPLSMRQLMADVAAREAFEPYPRGSLGAVLYRMREIMAEHLAPSGNFLFVDRGAALPGKSVPAGFYLAIYREATGRFAFLEAHDTWLHPEVPFEEFRRDVEERARGVNHDALTFHDNTESHYQTRNGNTIHFKVWRALAFDETVTFGAAVVRIDYGRGPALDTLRDAGNETEPFLRGTIMNSPVEGLIEIANPALGTKIILDWSDPGRLRRIDERGVVEEAGGRHDLWVDFAWTGAIEGDFYRPFNRIATAIDSVENGGVVHIRPGTTRERRLSSRGKRVTLRAPIGGVRLTGAGAEG